MNLTELRKHLKQEKQTKEIKSFPEYQTHKLCMAAVKEDGFALE